MRSYRDVIDQWPSVSELASDIGEKAFTVRKWRTRNSIPAEKWDALLKAAKKRGFSMNADQLMKLAAAA